MKWISFIRGGLESPSSLMDPIMFLVDVLLNVLLCNKGTIVLLYVMSWNPCAYIPRDDILAKTEWMRVPRWFGCFGDNSADPVTFCSVHQVYPHHDGLFEPGRPLQIVLLCRCTHVSLERNNRVICMIQYWCLLVPRSATTVHRRMGLAIQERVFFVIYSYLLQFLECFSSVPHGTVYCMFTDPVFSSPVWPVCVFVTLAAYVYAYDMSMMIKVYISMSELWHVSEHNSTQIILVERDAI